MGSTLKNINDSFIKTLNRVIDKTGMLTLFLSFGFFSTAAIIFNFTKALLVWVGIIGFGGALEIYHKQVQVKFDKRKQLVYHPSKMIMDFRKTYPRWAPKIIDELKHYDFIFHTIGFEEIDIPFGIAGPLCPNCQKPLIEDSKIIFPGRIHITFQCVCGYKKRSTKTKAELISDVSISGILPTQD